jgi:hypothetical protein
VAAVTYSAHCASLHSKEKTATLRAGTKYLELQDRTSKKKFVECLYNGRVSGG